MFSNQTLQTLRTLKLTGMADGLEQQLSQPSTHEELGFEERRNTHMPNMIGTIGRDNACGWRRSFWVALWSFFLNPSNRRYPQMQPCPA